MSYDKWKGPPIQQYQKPKNLLENFARPFIGASFCPCNVHIQFAHRLLSLYKKKTMCPISNTKAQIKSNKKIFMNEIKGNIRSTIMMEIVSIYTSIYEYTLLPCVVHTKKSFILERYIHSSLYTQPERHLIHVNRPNCVFQVKYIFIIRIDDIDIGIPLGL